MRLFLLPLHLNQQFAMWISFGTSKIMLPNKGSNFYQAAMDQPPWFLWINNPVVWLIFSFN